MNNYKYLLSGITMLSLISLNALADDNSIYPLVSIGLIKPASFNSSDDKAIDLSYTPTFSLGLGFDSHLSTDWMLTNELTLNYMDADFSVQSHSGEVTNGNTQQTGLWASTRLKRLNLIESVSPFIEVAVGVVDADYRYNNTKAHQWQKGYKAMTGLEFSTGTDATISIGIGYSNMNEDVNFSKMGR